MTEYIFSIGLKAGRGYETDKEAIKGAVNLSIKHNKPVTVFKSISKINPTLGGEELAEKFLNDTIEEPSQTLDQRVHDFGELLTAMQKINLEIFRKMVKVDFPESSKEVRNKSYTELSKETGQPIFFSDIITAKAASMELNESGGKTTPYELYQRRIEFLSNFKDGRMLYNSSKLFKDIANAIMRGACIYELLLEVIYFLDGVCKPDSSHLNPFDYRPR